MRLSNYSQLDLRYSALSGFYNSLISVGLHADLTKSYFAVKLGSIKFYICTVYLQERHLKYTNFVISIDLVIKVK